MASGGTIHYKFKSQKSYDTVTFDGVYISVANLKQLIAEKKGLDKEGTAELLLTNVTEDGNNKGVGQDLTDDQSLVWKNASIIVRRVPKAMGKTIGDAQELKEEKKRIYVKPPDAATLNMAQQAANRNRRNMLTAKREKRERMKKMREGEGEDLDNADDDLDNEEEALKEEKDIKDLIANETKQWDAERLQARNAKIVSKAAGNQPMQRQGIATRNNAAPVVSQGVQLAKEMQANKIMHQSYVRADGAGVPGPGYVCKRCNVPGHWIQDCPQGKDANVEVVRMKTAYGIPQNRLEGTDTGVLVGPTGESVEMKADETEFDRMMGFLTGKEEDEDDKMLMIGDKKDGEEENAGNEGEQHPFSPATAGVQSPTMAPPPGGPPPGGPPPLPMGPPPSTAETREERDKKRAEEKAAAKERFVNMSPEEVMNMDPAEMEKLMALIGDDENDEMMKMGDGGGGGGMPPPGMPPPHAQRYRRGPMGGFPSLGGGGYNNAVIVTEPKIDMTPEEEEEADRMLKTGDFSSIEAMLKTFGCTPEQIEHLMKTQPSFPNPFYGGGPPAKEGNLPVQDRVTRTPKRVFPGRSVQILARSFDSSAGPLETNRRRRSVLGLCARTMFSRRLVQIFARPEHFTQGFRKQSVSKRGRARRTAADAIWRQWWRRGRRRTVRVWWSKARARKLQRSIRRHYSTRRLARRSSELARRVRQSTKKR